MLGVGVDGEEMSYLAINKMRVRYSDDVSSVHLFYSRFSLEKKKLTLLVRTSVCLANTAIMQATYL